MAEHYAMLVNRKTGEKREYIENPLVTVPNPGDHIRIDETLYKVHQVVHTPEAFLDLELTVTTAGTTE